MRSHWSIKVWWLFWVAGFPINSQALFYCLETAKMSVFILKKLPFFAKYALGRISVQLMLTLGNSTCICERNSGFVTHLSQQWQWSEDRPLARPRICSLLAQFPLQRRHSWGAMVDELQQTPLHWCEKLLLLPFHLMSLCPAVSSSHWLWQLPGHLVSPSAHRGQTELTH